MALSGTINGSVTNKSSVFSFYATWSATQSIEGNYSDVTVNSYWKTSNIAYDFDTVGTRPASITIDGSVTSIEKRFNLNPWPSNPYLIQSVTKRIYHNTDGTKSITISASANGWANSYGPSSSLTSPCTASGTITLDSIPRASSFGTITGNTIGSSVTVNIVRSSASFTHYLWYKVGNSDWYDVGAVTGTSKSFTIDIGACSQLPNSTSGTMVLCLRTYHGTTESDVFKSVTVNVPTSVVPSIGNITWTKTSSEPSGWPITQGISTGTMAMTGVSGVYGSTISSYSLTFAGFSSSSSSLSITNIPSSGTLAAVAKVTDSRGRTATKTVNFTVAAYTKPKLSVEVFRSNASGTEDDYGDYMCVKATATITAVGDNSLQSLVLQYKKRSDSTYTSISLTSGTPKIVSASSDYTWDWTVTATDKISPVSSTDSIGTGEVIIDILANGKGLGIGKVAENEGLDLGWEIVDKANHLKSLSYRGGNAVSLANDTTKFWNDLGNLATTFYNNTGYVTDQPSTYGFILNLANGPGGNEVHQLWATQSNGNLLHRGGNASGWGGSWRTILDTVNLSTYIKDYVVEQGTSGIWTYRKWNSGIAECWGTRTITGVKVDKQWGSTYYAETPAAIAYPFTFKETPAETATMSSNNMSAWMASASINTSSSTGKYFLMRPDSAATTTYTVYIHYHATGRWK